MTFETVGFAQHTIVAQVTPRVPSAIAIIRISGSLAKPFLVAHSNITGKKLIPRHAHFVRLYSLHISKGEVANVSTEDNSIKISESIEVPISANKVSNATTGYIDNSIASSGKNIKTFKDSIARGVNYSQSPRSKKKKPIDSCLAIYFKTPHSFTGEDVVELYLHGSQVIADEVLQAALAFGIVNASRGEFSRRAFLNGKITALQAEATNALVHAATPHAAKNALRALEGKSGLKFDELSSTVHSMLAHLESSIEFPEEDLPQHTHKKQDVYETYLSKIHIMQEYLNKLIANTKRGKVLETGASVVLLGAVNAGKSTLMNLLLAEERAIVSRQAGATRDTLREGLMLAGGKVFVTDTAGLREAQPGSVEYIGIERAKKTAAEADCVLCLVASKSDFLMMRSFLGNCIGKHWFFILNKTDLLGETAVQLQNEMQSSIADWLFQSEKAGGGEKSSNAQRADLKEKKKNVDEDKLHPYGMPLHVLATSFTSKKEESRGAVFELLENYLGFTQQFFDDDPSLCSMRQLRVCKEILSHLSIVEKLLVAQAGEEEVLEELRYLRKLLSELNITVDDETVLSAMFSQFCIGK